MGEYYSKSTIESFLTYGISSNCMLTPANVMTILNAIPAVDAEQIVRCEKCKHAPINMGEDVPAMKIEFPDDWCPYNCPDHWYNEMPKPDWFCHRGEKRDEQSNAQAPQT